jgi:hypothetical protein
VEKQIEEIKDCIDSVYGCDCAYFGVDGLAIAEAIYNEGYRKQEWISVEERLPAEDVRVLVWLRKDHKTTYTRIDTDRRLNGVWVRWYESVTHWMPLPSAPKGE